MIKFLFIQLLIGLSSNIFCNSVPAVASKMELIKYKISAEKQLQNVSCFSFEKKKELHKKLYQINSQLGVSEGIRNYAYQNKLPSFITRSEVFGILASLPVFVWQLIFLLLLLFFCVTLFRVSKKKLIKLLFISIGLLFCFLFLRISISLSQPKGIILAQHAVVYSGPGSSYPELATVPLGSTVILHKSKNDFVQIESAGMNGWIRKSEVEDISRSS